MIDCESYKFCREHKLYYELELCLKAINRIFSGIVSVNVEVDCFDDSCFEITSSDHIVIRVNARLNQDYGMIQYDEYIDWFIKTIPTNKAGLLVLSLHRI